MIDNQLKLDVQDIFLTQDSAEAIRLLGKLKRQTVIDDSSRDLMIQMQYIRIASLSKDQLFQLLKDNLFAPYTIPDFNLAEKIKWYVDQVEIITEQVDVCKGVRLNLEINKANLGQKNILIKNQILPPTIANWIVDYNSWPTTSEYKGVFDEFEYINKSSNLKNLNEGEKEVLKNILNLYDYVLSFEQSWNNLPVPKNSAEAYKDFDLYKLIPGLEDEIDEEAERKKRSANIIHEPVQTTVAPTPIELAPESIPTKSISDATLTEQPQPRALEPLPDLPIINLPKTEPKPKPPVNPVQIAPTPPAMRTMDEVVRSYAKPLPDLSRPGVVKDPTNIKLDEEKKRISEERIKKMQTIQQKLADLKTRKQKNKNE